MENTHFNKQIKDVHACVHHGGTVYSPTNPAALIFLFFFLFFFFLST